VSDSHKTVDLRTVYRCLLVGLDDPTARACKNAVRPLDAVIVADIKEACAKISEILPLVVALPAGGPQAGMPELLELAGACGAELITISLPLNVQTARQPDPRRAQARRRASHPALSYFGR
jgi:hypothetical protein